MDKLKYIKLENPDGSYSSSIPLAVDSDHVDVNGNTLTNELATKATNTQINDLQSEINGLASGSPAGVYSTVSALISADPDHSKIYLVSADGKWYYYDGNSWEIGGIYQSTGLADNSISKYNLNSTLKNDIYYNEGTKNLYNISQEDYSLQANIDEQSQDYGKIVISSTLKGFILPVNAGSTITISKISSARFRISTTTNVPAVDVQYNDYYDERTNTSATIELGENDNYILVDYYSTTADTLTQEEIKNSIKVYYGTTWVDTKTKCEKLQEDLANEGVSTEYLQDNSVTFEKTKFFSKYNEGTENLYNISQEDYSLQANIDPGNTNYGKIVTSSTLKGFILPVIAESTITISKISSARFRVATTTNVPAIGVEYNNYYDEGSSTSATIELGQNDNYILVNYYSTTVDILTQEEIKNSIKVYYGTTWSEKKYKIDDLISSFGNLSPEVLNITSYRQLGSFDKGYLCLIADDGAMTLSTNTFGILQNLEVPATFALMSNSQIMDESTGDIEGLKNMINNYGCSVCQHGSTPFDEYTEDELVEFLQNEKEFWISKGIEVKGLCYPYHNNNPLIRSICGSMYDVCCGGWGNGYITTQYQLNTERSNIFALSRTSVVSYNHLNDAVDYAVANKKLMIVFWHDNTIANDSSKQTILENFINYAKSSGIEFITLDKILNL